METFFALLANLRGIHRSPVNSPHKGQWRGALMFSLICAWISSWVNNGEAGDSKRHFAHYDVTVICSMLLNGHPVNMYGSSVYCLHEMHCSESGIWETNNIFCNYKLVCSSPSMSHQHHYNACKCFPNKNAGNLDHGKKPPIVIRVQLSRKNEWNAQLCLGKSHDISCSFFRCMVEWPSGRYQV